MQSISDSPLTTIFVRYSSHLPLGASRGQSNSTARVPISPRGSSSISTWWQKFPGLQKQYPRHKADAVRLKKEELNTEASTPGHAYTTRQGSIKILFPTQYNFFFLLQRQGVDEETVGEKHPYYRLNIQLRRWLTFKVNSTRLPTSLVLRMAYSPFTVPPNLVFSTKFFLKKSKKNFTQCPGCSALYCTVPLTFWHYNQKLKYILLEFYEHYGWTAVVGTPLLIR